MSSQIPRSGEITLTEAMQVYEQSYLGPRRLAERSRVEYRNDINDLIAFLHNRGVTKIGQATTEHLKEYMANLEQRGYAVPTRRRKVLSVKAFFSFMREYTSLPHDPAFSLASPPIQLETPRVLDADEIKRLRAACAEEVRDAAIIELLLQTGIRLSELVGINADDVHLSAAMGEMGSVHIAGEAGAVERTVPLNSKASEAMRAFLAIRPPTAERGLFVTRRGTPLGARGFQALVDRYLRLAGVGNASVHTLRHTFAVNHLRRGSSLSTIQGSLGLKSLTALAVYNIPPDPQAFAQELETNAL
jgi:integrase/recombinase XerD